MMRVLLIHPPWQRFFGNRISMPPMALNHIAAYIKREIPAVVIDVYNADYAAEYSPLISSYLYAKVHAEYVKRLNDPDDIVWRQLRRVISDFKPDVLGVSAMTASYVSALRVCCVAKEINPDIKVVLGGKHPTALPEDTLKNKVVDCVVIGEGEETFRDFILNQACPENVPGMAYAEKSGAIVVNTARPYIRDIDKLPVPIFDSSINTYDYEGQGDPDLYTWSIVTARGCPFQCVYCASDKNVRFRSPDNVIREILQVKAEYGISRFCFEDDSFTLNSDRARDLCEKLKKAKVRWMCNTRVDLLSDAMVDVMQRSGCESIAIGIETGSPKTLKRINKKIDLDKIERAIRLLKARGVLVTGYFIIGFPWETREDIDETMRLVERLPLDDFQLNVATPLPGTQLFESLAQSGKIRLDGEDWARYHQGSLHMNFSVYPDEVWQAMISEYLYSAHVIYKKKMLRKMLRMFLSDPAVMAKKIVNKVVVGCRYHLRLRAML